jgi:hypothetical protein
MELINNLIVKNYVLTSLTDGLMLVTLIPFWLKLRKIKGAINLNLVTAEFESSLTINSRPFVLFFFLKSTLIDFL